MDCWLVVSTAVVLALCARYHAHWALEPRESLRQRCSFVLAILVVGVRLMVTRADHQG